jgi:hypothetical protein
MIVENAAKIYECSCGAKLDLLDSKSFKSHMSACKSFQATSQIMKLGAKDQLEGFTQNDLVALLYQLDLVRDTAKEVLVSSTSQRFQRLTHIGKRNLAEFENGGPITRTASNDLEDLQQVLKRARSNDQGRNDSIRCIWCLKTFDASKDIDKITYLSTCCHACCKACIKKESELQMPKKGSVNCPDCRASIQPDDLMVVTYLIIRNYYQDIIGKQEYDNLYSLYVNQNMQVEKCRKCGLGFIFEEGKLTDIVSDAKGVLLQPYDSERWCLIEIGCKESTMQRTV